ncbi:phage tail tube protein FII [Sphingomonas sp. F9_3S_D5_B_2]
MVFSKSKVSFALAAFLLPATAAVAQAINVGMQVTDASGAPVGTVIGVNGDNLTVKTDKHQAVLSKGSFTAANGKLLFGMSQAQLNAEIEKGLAAADASVRTGAVVKGAAGTQIGTIESADAEWVTIAVSSTQKLKIPRSGVRGNPDGTVTTGLTADQVQAELQKAATPASGE